LTEFRRMKWIRFFSTLKNLNSLRFSCCQNSFDSINSETLKPLMEFGNLTKFTIIDAVSAFPALDFRLLEMMGKNCKKLNEFYWSNSLRKFNETFLINFLFTIGKFAKSNVNIHFPNSGITPTTLKDAANWIGVKFVEDHEHLCCLVNVHLYL